MLQDFSPTFAMNISSEYLCRIFQVHYTLDSFIQYVGRLPTSRTRSRNVRGHYIGFRRMGQQWYRFDDGVVHKINIQRRYNVNLVFYRRQDIPPFISGADLSRIPTLGKVTVLNRKPSLRNAQDGDKKPDISSRPPLITPAAEKASPKIMTPLPVEHPERIQPSRHHKDYVVYYPYDSLSSSDDEIIDRTHRDEEYKPPKNKGRTITAIALSNSIESTYISIEYLTGFNE